MKTKIFAKFTLLLALQLLGSISQLAFAAEITYASTNFSESEGFSGLNDYSGSVSTFGSGGEQWNVYIARLVKEGDTQHIELGALLRSPGSGKPTTVSGNVTTAFTVPKFKSLQITAKSVDQSTLKVAYSTNGTTFTELTRFELSEGWDEYFYTIPNALNEPAYIRFSMVSPKLSESTMLSSINLFTEVAQSPSVSISADDIGLLKSFETHDLEPQSITVEITGNNIYSRYGAAAIEIAITGADAHYFTVDKKILQVSAAVGTSVNIKENVTVTFNPNAYRNYDANFVLSYYYASSQSHLLQGVAVDPEPEYKLIYKTGFEPYEGFEKDLMIDGGKERIIGLDELQWGLKSSNTTATLSPRGDLCVQLFKHELKSGLSYGYLKSYFDIPEIKEVKFIARDVSSATAPKLSVKYSIDGGLTFKGEQVFDIVKGTGEYTYTLESPQKNARLLFQYHESSVAEVKDRIMLDDISVYQDGVSPIYPYISATEGVLNFEVDDSGSVEKTIYVSGQDFPLLKGHTINRNRILIETLDDASEYFSLITSSILFNTRSVQDREVIVKYMPTENGTHQAYVRIIADNALPVYRKLEGVATGFSGLNELHSNAEIYALNKQIHFEAEGGEMVEVYNAMGQKIISQIAESGANVLPISASGLLVVKVGDRIGKVIN